MKKLYTILRHRTIRRIAFAGFVMMLHDRWRPVNNGMIDDLWNKNSYFGYKAP